MAGFNSSLVLLKTAAANACGRMSFQFQPGSKVARCCFAAEPETHVSEDSSLVLLKGLSRWLANLTLLIPTLVLLKVQKCVQRIGVQCFNSSLVLLKDDVWQAVLEGAVMVSALVLNEKRRHSPQTAAARLFVSIPACGSIKSRPTVDALPVM